MGSIVAVMMWRVMGSSTLKVKTKRKSTREHDDSRKGKRGNGEGRWEDEFLEGGKLCNGHGSPLRIPLRPSVWARGWARIRGAVDG